MIMQTCAALGQHVQHPMLRFVFSATILSFVKRETVTFSLRLGTMRV